MIIVTDGTNHIMIHMEQWNESTFRREEVDAAEEIGLYTKMPENLSYNGTECPTYHSYDPENMLNIATNWEWKSKNHFLTWERLDEE